MYLDEGKCRDILSFRMANQLLIQANWISERVTNNRTEQIPLKTSKKKANSHQHIILTPIAAILRPATHTSLYEYTQAHKLDSQLSRYSHHSYIHPLNSTVTTRQGAPCCNIIWYQFPSAPRCTEKNRPRYDQKRCCVFFISHVCLCEEVEDRTNTDRWRRSKTQNVCLSVL